MRKLLISFAVFALAYVAAAQSDMFFYHLPGGNDLWAGKVLPNALQSGFVARAINSPSKLGPDDKLFAVFSHTRNVEGFAKAMAELKKLHEQGTRVLLLIQSDTSNYHDVGCSYLNSVFAKASNVLLSKYGFMLQCEYSGHLWGEKSTIDAGVILPGLKGMLVTRGEAHIAMVFPGGGPIGPFHPISALKFYNGKKVYSFSAVSEDDNFLIVSLPGYDSWAYKDVLTEYTEYDNYKVAAALLAWLRDGKSLW